MHLKLGEVQMADGNHQAALARFDKALRLDPKSSPALCGKAQVFDRKGRPDKVASLLKPLVESGRETAAMARLYARALEKDGKQHDAIALIRRHLAADATPTISRRELNFLLAKIHERSGEFDHAFAAYENANAQTSVRYDPDAYRRRVDELIELFSPANLASFPRAEHGLDLPVFVIGMPRTGSTLVERIIDAHPQACGVGEIPLMSELVRTLFAG